jgi:hypothetical protein
VGGMGGTEIREVWAVNMNDRHLLLDLVLDVKIMLKCILQEYNGRRGTEFDSLTKKCWLF